MKCYSWSVTVLMFCTLESPSKLKEWILRKEAYFYDRHIKSTVNSLSRSLKFLNLEIFGQMHKSLCSAKSKQILSFLERNKQTKNFYEWFPSLIHSIVIILLKMKSNILFINSSFKEWINAHLFLLSNERVIHKARIKLHKISVSFLWIYHVFVWDVKKSAKIDEKNLDIW